MALSTDDKYAVVGIGGIFPGAPNLDQFWQNLLSERVEIRRLAADSIERAVFFRPETLGRSEKGDCSYTDLIASVDAIDFDSKRFRIPPTAASRIDRNQQFSLLVAEQALAFEGLEHVDRDRVCVFMGSSMVGQLHHDYVARLDYRKFEYLLSQHPDFRTGLTPDARQRIAAELRHRLIGHTVSITEDSAPGVLPNIIAARISAAFDLHGHAYVVDAACASGLAAIICGLQQLQLLQADAVVCGAVDVQNGEFGRTYFSGMGALSPEGSFPFDERANGFVIGDGAGALVLKRLNDALAAGNRIFAVITGFGQTSDGKGKAIAAPNELWQAHTIQRAWSMAGVPIDSVELIEAHGTATPVGDVSEVNALKLAFKNLGTTRTGFCGIGSVKSNIGHLKSAAGVAGFLKAVLALDRKYLPPTAGFRTANPKLRLDDSPFYILAKGRDWPAHEHPRRAGVSAFGFGGANYHIALEEFRREDYDVCSRHRAEAVLIQSERRSDQPETVSASFPMVPGDSSPPFGRFPAATQRALPLFVAGPDIAAVQGQLRTLLEEAQTLSSDLASRLLERNLQARPAAQVRIALSCHDVEELRHKLELALRCVGQPSARPPLQANGILFLQGAPLVQTETAVLFPGQGSQYPDMQRELRERFECARHLFVRADAIWTSLAGHGVSELIDSSQRGREQTEHLLRQTQHTHPALVVSSLATFHVLERLGFRPAIAVGHSVGEFTALTAARRIHLNDALTLVSARGNAFGAISEDARGAMLALSVSEGEARELLKECGAELAIANVNGPKQTIVSGDDAQIYKLAEYCARRSLTTTRLNVSHAFHSPLMTGAEAIFQLALAKVTFCAGTMRVMANGTNEYFGTTNAEVQQALSNQISGPVRFEATIRRLYAEGIRLFVEAGPGSVLSGLTREILSGKDALVLASDNKRGESDEAFVRLVCGLFVAGIDVDATPCFDSVLRPPAGSISLEAAPASRGGPEPKPSAPHLPKTLVVDGSASAQTTEPIRLVYSGVAIGLPGSFKDSFRDDNFEQLFEGRNHIERLTDEERQRLVDLRVSKLVKSEQGASFAVLSSLNEVIQLAGKLGRLNLARDYGLAEKEVASMSSAVAHAVAAGYEALRDAKIPLVHEYARTTAGSLLPERWALPQEMQASTGVIFANGFPMVDPIIREVSRHLSHRFGSRAIGELFEFYDTLLTRVTDRDTRKLLADWYSLNRGRLGRTADTDVVYQFNHQLMTQISMQANNRLARCLNARGPNFQINAACSSTSTAISLAEDMIRGGRARHMIVVGADDPTSHDALPYLGAGFLSTGACTNAADLYEAALPFDRRRNGMIMGAGAVALVIESECACLRRGTNPVCELLGTHVFNTAGHASQLDVPRYAEELGQFMTRMEAQHSLERARVARGLVYLSHETFTPPRGGCSESEAVALHHVFGDHVREIEVSNTKGMTGHTMGAALEDAVAAKALEVGRAAPVVNFREADPVLAGLTLSNGTPRQFEYALRMAAGFGSQGNYILLRRCANSGGRIADPAKYQQWLQTISGLDRPELADQGRVLIIKDTKPGAVVVNRPNIDSRPLRNEPSALPIQAAKSPGVVSVGLVSAPPSEGAPISPEPETSSEVRTLVFDLVSEVTGYATSILELDMELEADLGIDTVKQATVLARLAERLDLGTVDAFRLSDYPTLRSIVELCEKTRAAELIPKPRAERNAPQATPPASQHPHGVDAVRTRIDVAVAGSSVGSRIPTDELVFKVIAEVTGYSIEILDSSMELEADLGIDTVKQATILALLSERCGISEHSDLRMSDFSTIGQLVSWFAALPAQPSASDVNSRTAAHQPTAQATTQCADGSAPALPLTTPGEKQKPEHVLQAIYEMLASLTAYPSDMLEDDLSLQSDLGLSDAVIAQFRDALVRYFGLAADFVLDSNARLRDLAHEIGFAESSPSTSSCAPSATTQPSAPALGRQVLALHAAPAEGPSELQLDDRLIWVLGDDANSVAVLRNRFEARRARVLSLVLGAVDTLPDLETALGNLVDAGTPDLIVDLTAAPDAQPLLDYNPEQFATTIVRAADYRFVIYKRLVASNAQIKRILAVTALDGVFALDLSRAAPTNKAIYGLHLGFYKALRKAWPNTLVSILDLGPSLWAGDGASAVELIERELDARGPGVEVCYVEGHRHRVIVEDSTWEDVPVGEPLGRDEVVVATGGGSGITARILIELASRGPAQFALIGRTELDTTTQGLDFSDPKLVEAERATIQRELSAAGIRVTPRAIAERLARRERSAAIYSTLAELARLGATARYLRADASDPVSMQTALGQIRETFGPITTLICGAGLEVSHHLEQKSLEEFHRVHSVKSMGAYLLAWCCREDPLRRFVTMSSISGRLGNAAQIDYSAANSFLDLMMRTSRRPGIRMLSLLWSGWSEIGMAWRNEYVRENSEGMGLNLIQPRAGAQAAALEILAPQGPSEVIIHRGLGGVVDRDLANFDPAQYPFIDWVERRCGQVIRTHRHVSKQRDALIDQHRFAGVPYMPGVGFMEMMAETARLLSSSSANSSGSSVVFRELEFLEGFKLHHERARDVWLEVAPGNAPDEHLMTIWAPLSSAIAHAEPRAYARARVVLTSTPPPVALAPDWEIVPTADADYDALLETASTRKHNVRFGPLFNDACSTEARESSPVRWSAQGLEARQRLPRAQLTHAQYPLSKFQLNPAFLDALHQAGAVLAIQLTDHVYLPVGADEFVIFQPPNANAHYRVLVRLLQLTDSQARYDMVMVRDDGVCCAGVNNARFARINS